jgi:hypothetical protein
MTANWPFPGPMAHVLHPLGHAVHSQGGKRLVQVHFQACGKSMKLFAKLTRFVREENQKFANS